MPATRCPSAALHCLACRYGAFARDRHRALADCEIGVWLLAQTFPNSDRRVLAVLRETASRDTIRLWAVRAPFETKDELKARGYRWMRARFPPLLQFPADRIVLLLPPSPRQFRGESQRAMKVRAPWTLASLRLAVGVLMVLRAAPAVCDLDRMGNVRFAPERPGVGAECLDEFLRQLGEPATVSSNLS